eukprot:7380785-Prymnesium_polylepis.1
MDAWFCERLRRIALTLASVTVVSGLAFASPVFDSVRASGTTGDAPEAAPGSRLPWSIPVSEARRVSNSVSILSAYCEA